MKWTPLVLIQKEIYKWSQERFEAELKRYPNRKVRKNPHGLRLAKPEEIPHDYKVWDNLHNAGLIVYAINQDGEIVPMRTVDLYFHFDSSKVEEST